MFVAGKPNFNVMIAVKIAPELKKHCPKLCLGVIQCKVKLKKEYPELLQEIDTAIQNLEQALNFEKIREIPSISSSRDAYRTLGKAPSRYRLSAEALLRRIVTGKKLYQINNVVDLLNLVSIQTGFSIGGYNVDKIQGSVLFGIGKSGELYEGIGRGGLNIENLPVFRDAKGAFGSPTSDSLRTQIDCNCTKFLMIIISFQGQKEVAEAISYAMKLLETHADATQFETKLVES